MNARDMVDILNKCEDKDLLRLIMNAAKTRLVKLEHKSESSERKAEYAPLGVDVAANPGRLHGN